MFLASGSTHGLGDEDVDSAYRCVCEYGISYVGFECGGFGLGGGLGVVRGVVLIGRMV